MRNETHGKESVSFFSVRHNFYPIQIGLGLGLRLNKD